MIINFRWSKSRQEDNRLWGSSVNKTSYGFPTLGTVFVPPSLLNLINTNVLNLPINCVIAGQQPEEKKSKFITDFYGILKNIFRE